MCNNKLICEGFLSMKASTFILCSLRGCWLLWCLHFLFFQDALLRSHTIFFYNHSKHYSKSICICKCESVRVLVHRWCSWMQHRFLHLQAHMHPFAPESQTQGYRDMLESLEQLCCMHSSHFCITLKYVYGFLMFPRTTSMTFLEFELLFMARRSDMKLCSERVEACCFSWSLPGSIWSASLVLMLVRFSLPVVPVENMRACWSSRSTWKIRDKATRWTCVVQC